MKTERNTTPISKDFDITPHDLSWALDDTLDLIWNGEDTEEAGTAVKKITLPDGREAEVHVVVTTNRKLFLL